MTIRDDLAEYRAVAGRTLHERITLAIHGTDCSDGDQCQVEVSPNGRYGRYAGAALGVVRGDATDALKHHLFAAYLTYVRGDRTLARELTELTLTTMGNWFEES